MISLLTHVFNLLFSTSCISCGIQGPDLCKKCLDSLPPPKPSNHAWIVSLSNYKDSRVETIMRHIKNFPNDRLARILVMRMIPLISSLEISVIIPISIGRDRFRQRGYNQAELLARPLAKKLKISLGMHVLFKKRTTHKQGTTKSKKEREQNLKNSFGIKNPHLIKDKDILLVDDITTTGSTLIEARKVLLKNGARNVWAVTVAN